MQYYVKIFNRNTNNLVGYYKETGKNCISKLTNGMKYFNDKRAAQRVADDIMSGFLRDTDGHYYPAYTVVCGDSTRKPRVSEYRYSPMEEGDREYELTTYIRKNSYRTRE